MHCYADLPAGESDHSEPQDAPQTPPQEPTVVADASGPQQMTLQESTAATDAPDATADPGATVDPGASTTDRRSWLHPDSLLDDSMTVAVGLVAGVLAGVLTSVILLWLLPGALPFLVGMAAWVGATIYVARTRTVFGATRKAGYLLGGLLVVLPVLFAFTAEMQENTPDERLGLLAVLAFFAWPVAAVLAGAGYWLGGKAPD